MKSLFATTKGVPEYPDAFTDDVDGIIYFTVFFGFYNNVRLHGAIGYVTPAQRHFGVDRAILALRSARLAEARKMRLRRNRLAIDTTAVAGEIKDNQPMMCLTGNL